MAKKQVKMGLIALTLMTASNMMGSGVFMLPTTLGTVGWISVFGWLFTIIGVMALALVFAKTSMIARRKTGGIVAYAGEAFGEFIGFQTSICYWFAAWIGNVALLVAGVGYLAYFFPVLQNPMAASLTAIVILWISLFISSLGARTAGKVQSVTTIGMLIVVLGVGFGGWFWFRPEYFFEVYNSTGRSTFPAILIAASLALWGFLGVEGAVIASDQVENPIYTVPRATIIGLLIASICYVSSSSVIMGLMPHEKLVHSTAPFADAVRIMMGETAGIIAAVLSVFACFGSIFGWLIAQSETPKYAAQEGLLPRFFAVTNKNNVPMKSLIFTGILMSLCILLTTSPNLAEQFRIVILMSAFGTLMPYIYAVIALPIIMISEKLNRGRDYIFYLIMTVMAFCYSLFAILGSGANTITYGTILMIITVPPYCYAAWNKRRQQAEQLPNTEIK
ncbi:MAG: amino acid permease [Candidatus Tokpelaia sp.]|nr:MAG: amino acid permease [Candidatus Tokpelaia sp.]KAA6205775.1 MAG: amino acid permease [Candidatus Tokpelaia sp.]